MNETSQKTQSGVVAQSHAASSSVGTRESLDLAKLKRTGLYERTVPAGAVLADMQLLRQVDLEKEKKVRIWSTIGWVGVGVFVLGGICFAMEMGAIATPLMILGLFAAIVGFVMYYIHSRLNLDNRRYEAVAGLLKLLSKDMSEDSLVNVKLDFRPHNHRAKFLRDGRVGAWKVKYYTDKWLDMRGNFVDGTKYSVAMIEKQQQRSKTKVSRSGKRKHKQKSKRSSEAIVSLKIKEKRYPNAQNSYGKIRNVVKLPSWVELKAIEAEGDRLMLRASTTQNWGVAGLGSKQASRDGVNWMAMMFLSLYHALNVSK